MRSLPEGQRGERLTKGGSYILCASQIERAVAQEKTPDPFSVSHVVPFGRSALDLNDGRGWGEALSNGKTDLLLTFTPLLLARPIRVATLAANGSVVAGERAVVGQFPSVLRGGTRDIATSFGSGAKFTDGGFTNIGNRFVPKLPTENFAHTANGLTLRTASDAASVNVGGFNSTWRGLTPARIAPPPQVVMQNFTPAGAVTQVVDPLGNQGFIELWRAAGGQSPDAGSWMSRIRPQSASDARNVFALPPGSTGNRLIRVRLPISTVFHEGRALGQFGHDGLGNQIYVSPEYWRQDWFEFIQILPE